METYSFTAAARGFHYNRRFWPPKENETLDCLHEPGNAFDRFAIKTVNEKGEIVGHLPKEISRVTKYLLDRGFTMYCKLSSRHYRRSPSSTRRTRNSVRSRAYLSCNNATIKTDCALYGIGHGSLY